MNLSIIKELRKSRGLSQKALADLIDVSSAYIQQIECNKKNPSISTLNKIASALDIDASLLLDNSDNRKFVLYNSKSDFPSDIPLDFLNEVMDDIDNGVAISDKVDDIYLLENLYSDKIKHLKADYEDVLDKLSTENRHLRLSLAYLEAKIKNTTAKINPSVSSSEQEFEIDDDNIKFPHWTKINDDKIKGENKDEDDYAVEDFH